MAQEDPIYTLSCLCKASKLTIHTTPQQFILCHCANCQKWSGSAFASNIWFDKDGVKFVDSAKITKYVDKSTESGSEINRHFCNGCGCTLYLTSPYLPGIISATAGTIDGLYAGTRRDAAPPGSAFSTAEPLLEIYCRSKVPWVEVKSGTQQYEGGPPA